MDDVLFSLLERGRGGRLRRVDVLSQGQGIAIWPGIRLHALYNWWKFRPLGIPSMVAACGLPPPEEIWRGVGRKREMPTA